MGIGARCRVGAGQEGRPIAIAGAQENLEIEAAENNFYILHKNRVEVPILTKSIEKLKGEVRPEGPEEAKEFPEEDIDQEKLLREEDWREDQERSEEHWPKEDWREESIFD